MPELVDAWQKMSKKTQTLVQLAVGVVFCGVIFFFLMRPAPEGESLFFDLGLLVPLLLAWVVPRMLENALKANLKVLRVTLLCGVAGCMLFAAARLLLGQ